MELGTNNYLSLCSVQNALTGINLVTLRHKIFIVIREDTEQDLNLDYVLITHTCMTCLINSEASVGFPRNIRRVIPYHLWDKMWTVGKSRRYANAYLDMVSVCIGSTEILRYSIYVYSEYVCMSYAMEVNCHYTSEIRKTRI